MPLTNRILTGMLLWSATCALTSAQATQNVSLKSGPGTLVVSGTLQGDKYLDYKINLVAGQSLTVALKGSNPQNYFNVNPPGSEVSMYVGSSEISKFQRLVPVTGIYTVRVYLMRPAARRNEKSRFKLSFQVQGSALRPIPVQRDALVPGTPFYATADVPASLDYDPSLKSGKAGVIRYVGDRTATVEVKIGGLKRRILFVKGKPVASDATVKLTFTRKEDTTIVKFAAQESYTLPDAFLFGG